MWFYRAMQSRNRPPSMVIGLTHSLVPEACRGKLGTHITPGWRGWSNVVIYCLTLYNIVDLPPNYRFCGDTKFEYSLTQFDIRAAVRGVFSCRHVSTAWAESSPITPPLHTSLSDGLHTSHAEKTVLCQLLLLTAAQFFIFKKQNPRELFKLSK